MKHLLLLAALTLSAASAMAKDIHTIVMTTAPQMHCHSCEAKITDNLRYVKGVKRIVASAAEQTVTVVIDADKTSPDALVKSLAKVGYTATVVKDTPAERADKPVQPKPAHEKKGKKQTETCSGDNCCSK